MNKVVIFDWGGVVESHENNCRDLKDAKIRLIKKLNSSLSDTEILKRWPDKNRSGIVISTMNQEEDIMDWFDFIQQNMNINISFEEFKRRYEEEFKSIKYYKEVVEYAHSLKDKCKIAILSNLTPFDKKRIHTQYDLSQFDYVYLSFEIGLRKPDEKIYQYVLNDLNTSPENILFIDDDTDNVLAAKKCGFHTCQAFGYELDRIKEAVNNFLKD